ncbi:MAG: hypothetical protein A2945_03380 [Candidatus Liptonbacteria bacterium RIFCSPLOWO2_01_FULL_52_25]|uniref:Uncharacterized protein n=1 Tax=Candidatus Liptonbacteria bacterium RIFCSPLOWO2_01_FULL_52_25 TaxID=1798650 RepID=A0A1G2CG36_9BACT|nr:MAG: hypothetical protein A2945_03380 [Candidatus Liptonbacteria bacterium RIFCSPLOWO2_01_FULL_52_25]
MHAVSGSYRVTNFVFRFQLTLFTERISQIDLMCHSFDFCDFYFRLLIAPFGNRLDLFNYFHSWFSFFDNDLTNCSCAFKFNAWG